MRILAFRTFVTSIARIVTTNSYSLMVCLKHAFVITLWVPALLLPSSFPLESFAWPWKLLLLIYPRRCHVRVVSGICHRGFLELPHPELHVGSRFLKDRLPRHIWLERRYGSVVPVKAFLAASFAVPKLAPATIVRQHCEVPCFRVANDTVLQNAAQSGPRLTASLRLT